MPQLIENVSKVPRLILVGICYLLFDFDSSFTIFQDNEIPQWPVLFKSILTKEDNNRHDRSSEVHSINPHLQLVDMDNS